VNIFKVSLVLYINLWYANVADLMLKYLPKTILGILFIQTSFRVKQASYGFLCQIDRFFSALGMAFIKS
jgi:hypothetical protein